MMSRVAQNASVGLVGDENYSVLPSLRAHVFKGPPCPLAPPKKKSGCPQYCRISLRQRIVLQGTENSALRQYFTALVVFGSVNTAFKPKTLP